MPKHSGVFISCLIIQDQGSFPKTMGSGGEKKVVSGVTTIPELFPEKVPVATFSHIGCRVSHSANPASPSFSGFQ